MDLNLCAHFIRILDLDFYAVARLYQNKKLVAQNVLDEPLSQSFLIKIF